MALAAGILGGLGAVGAIGSSVIQSNASTNAANASLNQQQQHFDIAQNALNPFVSAGQSVLPTLQSLITPGANQNATLSQTPGFQFASQYGSMAATNSLAAKTGPSAGPLATAISQYNNGLAQNTWQSNVSNLQNFANIGANSAGNLAQGSITSGTNMGGTAAAGIMGSGNALAGGVSGATGSASNALLLNQLLGSNNGLYGGAPGTQIGGTTGSALYGGPGGPSAFT